MKNYFIVLCISLVGSLSVNAQVIPPYTNNFDLVSDSTGWSHYAITGSDDWTHSTPSGTYFYGPASSPYSWGTNLGNYYVSNSNRALETPYFNFPSGVNYTFGFYQMRRSTNSTVNYIVEYRVGAGSSWQPLISATTKKRNWQSATGFSGNAYGGYVNSTFCLDILQGVDSVKFRFRFVSASAGGEGWVIDNFSIVQETLDIQVMPADSMLHRSQYCNTFTVNTFMNFHSTYGAFPNQTRYFLSDDQVLDASDLFLASKTQSLTGSYFSWQQAVTVPTTLNAGYHYILFKHDYLDSIPETNENNNLGVCVLQIDSTYTLPYVDTYDTLPSNLPAAWNIVKPVSTDSIMWYRGKGFSHHLEDTHSGDYAWHSCHSVYNPYPAVYDQYLVSPYLDLTSASGTIYLNVWFKDQIAANGYKIDYYTNCDPNYWGNLTYMPSNRDDEWDFTNIDLASIVSNKNAKLRFHYMSSYMKPEGLILDDIYIGPAKPDLSIERDKQDRFTDATQSTYQLKYYLVNSGRAAAPATQTAFWWSTDTILDPSDLLLTTKSEAAFSDTARVWTSVILNKPTTAAGTYYVFYLLDSTKLAAEMREYNNSGYFVVRQTTPTSVPYYNDFETQITDWRHEATLGKDEWVWTVPSKPILNHAFSGTKAWVTNAVGNVSPMSRMHLYTPVFDFTGSTHPVMNFHMKLHGDQVCSCFEAKANVSFSTDGGATWKVLDTLSQSYKKWYYSMVCDDYGGRDAVYYQATYGNLFMDPYEHAFVTFNDFNGRDERDNYDYILDIAQFAGLKNVQFRFNLATKNANGQTNYEGAMIDNFRISEYYSDLLVPYKKALMASSLASKVKVNMHIKNAGNYRVGPTVIKFYVSTDTTLDASDQYVGQDTLQKEIRPEMNYFLATEYPAPSNFFQYKYLIYELDATNVVAESNELNNVSYWPLGLDSISSFPYFTEFEDTVMNGWYQHTMTWGLYDKLGYRYRNLLAPAEYVYQSARASGQMTTDPVNSTISWGGVPTMYVESPAFNFQSADTIHLSFTLMCIGAPNGSNSSGGNLDYSTDGGQTWSFIDPLGLNSYHWFNSPGLASLNEPGWAKLPSNGFDSCFTDITFLKGSPSVIFRFKYCSNYAPYGNGTAQGMRIENFRITAKQVGGTSIDPLAHQPGIYVSGQYLFITSPVQGQTNYDLVMYNTSGQQIISDRIEMNDRYKYQLPDVVPGLYFIRLSNAGAQIVKSVIITK